MLTPPPGLSVRFVDNTVQPLAGRKDRIQAAAADTADIRRFEAGWDHSRRTVGPGRAGSALHRCAVAWIVRMERWAMVSRATAELVSNPAGCRQDRPRCCSWLQSQPHLYTAHADPAVPCCRTYGQTPDRSFTASATDVASVILKLLSS